MDLSWRKIVVAAACIVRMIAAAALFTAYYAFLFVILKRCSLHLLPLYSIDNPLSLEYMWEFHQSIIKWLGAVVPTILLSVITYFVTVFWYSGWDLKSFAGRLGTQNLVL